MKTPPSPFAWVNGQPYLIVNFTLEPRDDLPSLRELLEGLLEHHPRNDIFLLRPLSRAEVKLLKRSTNDAEVEAWAQIAVNDEDRLRSRR